MRVGGNGIWRRRAAGVGTAVAIAVGGLLSLTGSGCSENTCDPTESTEVGAFTDADVVDVIARAASHALDRGTRVTIAISDREGDPLGVFRMDGSPGTVDEAYRKARTGAFFSSNGEAFTSRTAGFIIQPHYPPGVANTAGGPLFGVPFSSLSCSDIKQNGASLIEAPVGLAGNPGGLPIYDGVLAGGGIGVAGSGDPLLDEEIALAGTIGREAPRDFIATQVVLDGIRLPFTEAETPEDPTVRPIGDIPGRFEVAPSGTPPRAFPQREIAGVLVEERFPTLASSALSSSDVELILSQAVAQAEETRAAIRQCGPARVFVAVVDLDGRVLGTVRTPDATIFSFDVAVQKARTAVAFSNPGHPLGREIRDVVGLPADAPFGISTRAIGFLAQDFYPPGVDGNAPGPLFGRQGQLSATCAPFGNGITIFPGGLPLYRDTQLVGGIGISGDGVDQDDIIAGAGTVNFEPPPEIRSDNFEFGGTRLPYFKEPRNPSRF